MEIAPLVYDSGGRNFVWIQLFSVHLLPAQCHSSKTPLSWVGESVMQHFSIASSPSLLLHTTCRSNPSQSTQKPSEAWGQGEQPVKGDHTLLHTHLSLSHRPLLLLLLLTCA